MIRLIILRSLIAAGFCAALSVHARAHLETGKALPELSFTGSDGVAATSSSFKGKALILVYLRPDQKYSMEAMIEIDRALMKFGSKGVRCLAICSETATAPAFLAKLNKIMASKLITYAIDKKGAILTKLGVMVSPTTLVLDKELKLRYRLPQISPAYARNLQAHLGLVLGTIDQEYHDEVLESNGTVERWMFNHHGSRVSLARELIVVTEEQRALKDLDDLIKDPHDDLEQLQALKCIALLNLGKAKEAEVLFMPILKSDQSLFDVKLAKIRIAFERGDLSSVGKTLLTIKTGDAEIKRLVVGLGRLPLGQHKRKNAQAYLKLIEGKAGTTARE